MNLKYICMAILRVKFNLKTKVRTSTRRKYFQQLSFHFVGIQTVALLVTLWISYGHPEHNKRTGDSVLGTECGLSVSESLFSFYTDYSSQK